MSRLPESLCLTFAETRRAGRPPGDSHLRGEARNGACGDVVVLWLAAAPDGHVTRAGFQAAGCPATLASAAAVCELLDGRRPVRGWELEVRADFERRFGAPAAAHAHGLALVIEALRGLAPVARPELAAEADLD